MRGLELHRSNDRLWLVLKDQIGNVVGEIHLDHWGQVDDVVLYADSSEEVQLEILRLAASHAKQYVQHRTTSAFGGLMVVEHRNHNLTRKDSDRFMDFATIPSEIQEMDQKTIVKSLRELYISVIIAVHRRFEDAVDAAIAQVGVASLKYEIVPQRMIFDNEVVVRFTVEEPNNFTFWHSTGRPTPINLYIVPAYHPVMNGKESIGLVNADTDAYIRGNAVRSIYCPDEARASDSSKNFGTSWNHVKHPYYAKGQSFKICLITTKVRATEGMEELAQVLRATLGLDNKYMEISGGFRAPLKCGHNRLLELGRRSPWPGANYDRQTGNIARGSEEFCVWAYRVLSEENQLEKAYVPSWFIKEGWLEIYENAEVGHGLY